jgi:hypothetical protein
MKNGICPQGTHAHIRNKRACEAAANNLNMGTEFIKATSMKKANLPKGCFFGINKDKLFFNKMGKTDATNKKRHAICCEKPEYNPI